MGDTTGGLVVKNGGFWEVGNRLFCIGILISRTL
jgi:hypothetical protein